MIDFTSWRVFIQRHQSKTTAAVASLVIFAAGWQLGRVTSPYYAAAPIVFQDRADESAGTGVALQALQNEGTNLAQKTEPAMPSPAPQVSQAPVAQVAGSTQGQFVASKNSNLYHHVSCPSAKQIKPANQRWFATAEAAKAAGLQPSKCTVQKVGN